MNYFDNVDCVYGPYTNTKSGRQTVTVHMKDGRKRFMSYPKFLVEIVLGRELDCKLETVDHIDHDFTNNSWDNMRLVDIHTHSSEDNIRVAVARIACVWCGTETHRRPKEIRRRLARDQAGPFCSKVCSGQYSKAKQTGTLPKASSVYNQYAWYMNQETIYYTVEKGGETITDMAERLGLDLPSEEEILTAMPRRQVSPRKPKALRPCVVCGMSTKNQKYCSAFCSAKAARKVKRPSKEKLHYLVWKYPTSYIAQRLGVSDSAVAKWCRQYGIDKPPRGYWAKKRANK